MKGSLVHAIIASLDEKARKKFLASRPANKEWDQLSQLFRLLTKQEQYSEVALLGGIGQTKRVKNLQIEQIGAELVAFLGEGKPEVLVHQILATAPHVIENRLERQAVELIEWGISMAESSENYHAVQSLWRLAELFPEPRPQFRGMTYEHALAAAGNLVAYRQLEVRLRQTPTIPDAEERSASLQEIEASPLLESPGMALGYESRLLYWRIKAICKYLAKNYEGAIAPQTNLVETLAERRDQDLDLARRWIKEAGTLAALHGVLHHFGNAKKVWNNIAALETPSLTLHYEKIKQLYPAMITVGMDTGDDLFTEEASSKALSLMETNPQLFSVGLQCDVLFHCASYFLASNRIPKAAKILFRLRGFAKTSFRPPIYAMTKVLEIVLEIEQGTYEDAIRLCKNLRMSKHDRYVPGMGVGLQLLAAIATSISDPGNSWFQISANSNFKKMTAELEGQPILDYFNLVVWIESKANGYPMMKQLHHRANPNG